MESNAESDSLVELFLRHLKIDRGASTNTIASYARDLRQFLAQSETSLSARTEDDIETFLSALKSKNLESTSIARKISALRQFYRFLGREGVIGEDPTLFIATPVTPKRLPKALREEDLTALLQTADQGLPYEGTRAGALRLRDRTMIYLLYATGLRVSELISVQTQKLDTESGLLRVTGKRNKERIIPFPPFVSELLHRYRNEARPLLNPDSDTFFVGLTGAPLTRNAFWKTLGKIALQAGIPGLHPHRIRHTFATDLLSRGMNLRVLQSLLGHADLQTTGVYTHVAPEHLREVVRRYHPRGKKE